MGPKKGHFLANLFKEMALFKAKNMEANFEQLLGQFLANLLQKMAIFSRQKKEAHFEQFWVNYWPIYFQKWPFPQGKKGAQFWAVLGQFWANFFPKMAISSRQKRSPILNNFGPILGQFLSKNGHFLGQKHGGQFWTTLGQFWAHFFPKMAIF